jgi:3-hydroxybutyryl-CoA dehydratase
MAEPKARGYYFEDFAEGLELTSPGRTVTEADVVQFAGLSGDYNQLHTDAVYAEGTQFGRRIAHGLLGLAIGSGLAARAGFVEGTALAFLGLEWRFKAPIYIGDTICLHAAVSKTRPMRSAGGGLVVFDVRLVNQSGATVQQGEWSMLMCSRPE